MPGGGDPRPDVFVVHPDGSGLTDLTTSVDADSSYGPRWSPDGGWLLFVGGHEGLHSSELRIANAAGDQAFQVTQDPRSYSSYAWAPEARTLAGERASQASSVDRGSIYASLAR